MARKSRAERHEAHRREVEAHKQRLREEILTGGHIFAQEWYREHTRNGDHAAAEAIEEMLGEISRHNRDNPAPPGFGMDDGRERARDLESRRREARDNEKAADIAEAARRKAAGIGGGIYATTEPEPEPEEDEPDQEAEEYEQQRRALMGHGLVSRMPAPPQPPRKKKRKRYVPPPFVG